MMYLAVSEDDIPKAESLVNRVGKDYADSLMFAEARGDTTQVGRLLAEARGAAPFNKVTDAVWQVGQWLGQPGAAEPFARAAAARPDRLARGNLLLAENLLAQGRWAEADSAIGVAVRAGTGPVARLERGLIAALPFLAVPHTSLEAIRADVAAVDLTSEAAESSPSSDLLPAGRLFILGLLDSRLGRPDAALKGAAQLDGVSAGEADAAVIQSLAATIRADVALGGHRPADALKDLEAVRGAVPLDLVDWTPFSEDYGRFLRCEALLESRNDDEALRWLSNGFDGTPDQMWYQAQVSLRLADIYERKGERQKAIDQYQRFVTLWRRSDPALQPAVEEARARLASLTGEQAGTPGRTR
ncbi:MAG TPA: hypothetical protein VMG41_10480 [Gemmatimonadales bacterium]|nr:hypothetical protein [Gemmatimonadales bacterium]